MAAVGAFDPTRLIPAMASAPASASPAPQAPASPTVGHSGQSSFDPVGSTINGQNSQASARSNLAIGDYATKEGILGQSNAAWSWHQLRKELIALMK